MVNRFMLFFWEKNETKPYKNIAEDNADPIQVFMYQGLKLKTREQGHPLPHLVLAEFEEVTIIV